MNEKMNEFIKIASLLKQHNIKVLLFGSLGLKQHIDEISNIDDIDILLPHTYVTDRWDELQMYMNKLGYFLEDLHEHQFNNGKYKVAFASIEDLKSFAGIEIESIPIEKIDNMEYLLLTLEQYLLVYNQSSKDSYRRNKNNDKDLFKIELIKKKLDKLI
ncbi:MAG: hypothetical protein ACRDA3_12415 [Peptostreptococcaceae bacterium]